MPFKFSENKTPENLDNVNDELHNFYEPVEAGGFKIVDKMQVTADAWDGMVTANTTIRGENKQLKGAVIDLSPLKDFGKTVEEIKTTFGTRNKELTDQLEGKADFVKPDKIREEMTKGFETEKAELQAENKLMENALYHNLVVAESMSALKEEKGDKLLLPFIKQSVRMEKIKVNNETQYVARIIDTDGLNKLNGNGLPMTVREHVHDMRGNKDYVRMFESTQKVGSGATSERVAGHAPQQKAEMTAAQKIQWGVDHPNG